MPKFGSVPATKQGGPLGMKKFNISVLLILIVGSVLLLFESEKAVAFEGNNYELSLCTIDYPDGTKHLAAQCIYPNPNGPCDRIAVCSGGAPPPEVK